MDIKEINQIFTDHLFKSNSNRNVFQAGIGKTLSSSVKKLKSSNIFTTIFSLMVIKVRTTILLAKEMLI